MKKCFGLFVFILILVFCAAAAADVAIDAAHFPDAAFMSCVKQFDQNGNGTLEDGEIGNIQQFNFPGAGIRSIEGIQYLTALESIDLHDNMIESADFSHNPELTYITVYSNLLTSLNVSKNAHLRELGCSNNRLTSLTLPKSAAMAWLDITSNSIKTLDVTTTPNLAEAVSTVAPTDYIYWDGGYSINWIVDEPGRYVFLAVDKNVTVMYHGNPIVQPTDVTELKYDGVVYALNKSKKTAAVSGVTDVKATALTVADTVSVFEVTYKVTAINDRAFRGLKKLKSVTIGNKVKTIGKNAFESCTKLSAVSGGAAVTGIGHSAFSGCKVLKTVPDLKKLQTVGPNAFKGCTKLAKITLGKSVKSIGTNAFYNCKALKTIKVETTKLSAKNVGDNAFKYINKKATFTCPKAKLNAYKALFVQKGAAKTCKFK